MAVAGRRAARLPAAVPAIIVGGWVLAIAAQASGRAKALHHDALIGHGLPLWGAEIVFLLAWQVMVATMMVPSSVPMIRHFVAASGDRPGRRGALAAFLGGYALVWTLFGGAAFGADLLVHHAVDVLPGLGSHPWYVAAGVLAVAGAFQFSGLKERCLDQCRHPAAWLLRRYQRGAGAAFRLGRDHGVFCVGCCWALMLLMFAAGVANLAWMAGLGAAMAYEKVGRYGRRLTPVVGCVLLGWAVVVAVHPPWLPGPLAGAT